VKEVRIVKYQKPEVLVLARAIGAIESHVKPIGFYEFPDTNPLITNPADE
jgi:hypothetical protein